MLGLPELRPLRVRAFRHLAAAYTINELGNWVGDVALAILVFDHTGSPVATAILFVSLRFAPGLLAPALTTRVEIIPPRRVLPSLYIGEAAIFTAIALLASHFSLAAILVLAALDGVLAVTARALIRSTTVGVLGMGGLLREGNAIINLGITGGGAIGPALAGLMVASAGAAAALAVDAASFAVIAIIIVATPGLHGNSDREAGTLGRLRAGVAQAWGRPSVRRLLVGAAIALLFGAAVIPIEVVFAKRTLHAGDSGYGLLMTAWGAGMLVGGAAFASLGKASLPLLISAGMALIGAGYAGLAASPNLALACFFSAVGGAGNGLWSTAVITALQQSIPQTAQAAVMAVLESINQISPAIGFVLGGLVAAASSARVAYAVSALGIAAVLIAQTIHPLIGLGKPELLPDEPEDSPTRRDVSPRSTC